MHRGCGRRACGRQSVALYDVRQSAACNFVCGDGVGVNVVGVNVNVAVVGRRGRATQTTRQRESTFSRLAAATDEMSRVRPKRRGLHRSR